MKQLLLGAVLLALSGTSLAADVAVSVTLGQPGFYGTINLGNMPPPQLIYTRPVVIQQPVGVVYQPVYLRVPPGHEKNWGKHCMRYNACGRPVYFVQDNWYTNVYAPRYRSEHGGGKGKHGPSAYYSDGKGHDKNKNKDKDTGHGRDNGHDKGNKNKGKGHD